LKTEDRATGKSGHSEGKRIAVLEREPVSSQAVGQATGHAAVRTWNFQLSDKTVALFCR